jgi:hypothetical protein
MSFYLIVLLNVVRLSVVTLSIIMLNYIMLSVFGPSQVAPLGAESSLICKYHTNQNKSLFDETF